MSAAWAAIIGAVIGAGGALMAQMLGTASQHQRWVADCKRQEYREVFDALEEYRWQVTNYLRQPARALLSPDLVQALHHLWSVLVGRMFIRRALSGSGFFQAEVKALGENLDSAEQTEWQARVQAVIKHLREIAWDDLDVPARDRYLGDEPNAETAKAGS